MCGLWSARQWSHESVTPRPVDVWAPPLMAHFCLGCLQTRRRRGLKATFVCRCQKYWNSTPRRAPHLLSFDHAQWLHLYFFLTGSDCLSEASKEQENGSQSQPHCGGESWGACTRVPLASGGHVSIITQNQLHWRSSHTAFTKAPCTWATCLFGLYIHHLEASGCHRARATLPHRLNGVVSLTEQLGGSTPSPLGRDDLRRVMGIWLDVGFPPGFLLITSTSQRAWSSFNALFPALIALVDREETWEMRSNLNSGQRDIKATLSIHGIRRAYLWTNFGYQKYAPVNWNLN